MDAHQGLSKESQFLKKRINNKNLNLRLSAKRKLASFLISTKIFEYKRKGG